MGVGVIDVIDVAWPKAHVEVASFVGGTSETHTHVHTQTHSRA